MNQFAFSRTKRGFTLFETLSALGIIVVLLSLAIPSVITLRTQLKMRELNSSARILYVSAQNRLTAMQASGEFESFFAATGGYQDNSDTTSDSFLSLFPAGTIELEPERQHIIVLFSSSGSVLKAFFWESDLDYNNVRNFNAAECSANQIGYYDGTNLDGNVVIEQLPAPEIEIVNGDSLSVRVSFACPSDLSSDQIISTLSIRSETQSGAWHAYNVTPVIENVSPITLVYTLDSMIGVKFKDFSGAYSDLLPGDDLSIMVKLSTKDVIRRSSSAICYDVNSLYASRESITVGTEISDYITVSNSRHLQNLCVPVSGFSTHTDINVEQTAAITLPDDFDFIPITNEWLKTYTSLITSEDTSTTYPINNLSITTDGNAGLFALLSGTADSPIEINSVKLINPAVAGAQNAGSLIGNASFVSLFDCAAYINPASGDINNYKITGTHSAGGLIGSASSCLISACFASLPRITGNYTGGLIGSVTGTADQGTTVSRCYANTYSESGSNITGGLIGFGFEYTINHSYALAANPINPLAPLGGTIADCYYVTNDTATDLLPSWDNHGLTRETHPYSDSFTSKAFPNYPAIAISVINDAGETLTHVLDHYGDWPEYPQILEEGFGYYELYDGTADIGYCYYTDHTLQSNLSELDANLNDYIVSNDGYAYFSQTQPDGTSAAVGTVLISGHTVNIYPLLPEKQQESTPLNGYRQVSLGENNYYYNPLFAKEVYLTTIPLQNSSRTFKIRSARQFNTLSRYSISSAYPSVQFLQEKNIDYTKYIGHNLNLNTNFVQAPIPSFSRTYDGGCYWIQGVSVSAEQDDVGLFSTNSGTLKNIVFRSTTSGVQSVIGIEDHVGGLVGQNSGSIINCAVAGLKISGLNDVGGMVGTNDGGQIENCSSANLSVTGYENVGGLVGKNEDDSKILHCYALGSVNGQEDVGGFCGDQEDDEDIAYCYSASSLLKPSVTFGFSNNNDDDTINYYLADAFTNSLSPLDEDDESISKSFAALQNTSIPSFSYATSSYSYNYVGQPYPFPAVVKNAAGQTVHYGDWPQSATGGSPKNRIGMFYNDHHRPFRLEGYISTSGNQVILSALSIVDVPSYAFTPNSFYFTQSSDFNTNLESNLSVYANGYPVPQYYQSTIDNIDYYGIGTSGNNYLSWVIDHSQGPDYKWYISVMRSSHNSNVWNVILRDQYNGSSYNQTTYIYNQRYKTLEIQ